MRQTAIQHSAESTGRQFLLSGREVEVLALYAQGLTQKRMAQEPYISQGTIHAHIKKIYRKTGFHSRQEILDYMERYTQQLSPFVRTRCRQARGQPLPTWARPAAQRASIHGKAGQTPVRRQASALRQIHVLVIGARMLSIGVNML